MYTLCFAISRKVARRVFESLVVQKATPTPLVTCITSTFYKTQTSILLSQTEDLLTKSEISKHALLVRKKQQGKCLKFQWSVPTPTLNIHDVHTKIKRIQVCACVLRVPRIAFDTYTHPSVKLRLIATVSELNVTAILNAEVCLWDY